MKKLIFVRHGSYDATGLSVQGYVQARKLTSELIPVLSGHVGNIAVYTSVAPRAVQTGEVIAEGLGATAVATIILGDIFGDPQPFNDVLQLIQENDVEALILVSHLKLVIDYTRQYAARVMGVGIDFFNPQVGQAIMLDLVANTAQTFT